MVILTSFASPVSNILHEEPNTKVVLDDVNLGMGTLFVSERTLCWKGAGGSGFSVEYKYISLHAESSDPTVYPTQCLLLMTDGKLKLADSINQVAENSDSDSESNDSEEPGSCLLLIPTNLDAIPTIYSSLSQCQLLTGDIPSDSDDDDDEDEDEEMYNDAEDYDVPNGIHVPSNIAVARENIEVNQLSSQLNIQNISGRNVNFRTRMDDQQFEDAD